MTLINRMEWRGFMSKCLCIFMNLLFLVFGLSTKPFCFEIKKRERIRNRQLNFFLRLCK